MHVLTQLSAHHESITVAPAATIDKVPSVIASHLYHSLSSSQTTSATVVQPNCRTTDHWLQRCCNNIELCQFAIYQRDSQEVSFILALNLTVPKHIRLQETHATLFSCRVAPGGNPWNMLLRTVLTPAFSRQLPVLFSFPRHSIPFITPGSKFPKLKRRVLPPWEGRVQFVCFRPKRATLPYPKGKVILIKQTVLLILGDCSGFQ